MSLYADDTNCKLEITCAQDCVSLQDDLYYLESWSSTWKLRFNESKCAVIRMCLGEPKSNHPYMINNSVIASKNCYKDLGVLVCSDLTWSDVIMGKA